MRCDHCQPNRPTDTPVQVVKESVKFRELESVKKVAM
jgi:hypothetical protein